MNSLLRNNFQNHPFHLVSPSPFKSVKILSGVRHESTATATAVFTCLINGPEIPQLLSGAQGLFEVSIKGLLDCLHYDVSAVKITPETVTKLQEAKKFHDLGHEFMHAVSYKINEAKSIGVQISSPVLDKVRQLQSISQSSDFLVRTIEKKFSN